MPQKLMRLLLSWLLLRALEAFGLVRAPRSARPPIERPRQSETDARISRVPDRESIVPAAFARLLRSWLVLLLLGGVEFAISFLPFGRFLRPLLMIPALAMVAVVAVNFMEVGKGPTIVRGFAVAAMFWLIVLLGLGSMDPLTRVDNYVPHAHVN